MNSYRLQLSAEHGLGKAAETLGYLQRLGVTVVYTSPYFLAGSGSSGYDVCDYQQIQPELGGNQALAGFAAALREWKLGHMLDLVPNHMGVDTERNRWWRDVLTYGAQSGFAGYFDIDWDPVKPELRRKILLPVLNVPYGAALQNGEIRLARVSETWVVFAGSQNLPVRPGSVADDTAADRLSPEELHTILERQVYRLAHWRTASDEINYRRFFDIDGLVGLRVEDEEVFYASHERVARLIADGVVTGIRVDHADGLARPAEYFQRLRRLTAESSGRPLHVVAEKILADHEHLPSDWPVDGTTGYEFLNLVGGLLVHQAGATRLGRFYARVTRREAAFDEECYRSKKTIMATTMVSEVNMLAHRLNRISERHPRSRDFTLNSLRRALMEIVACLQVYRTYISDTVVGAEDAARIQRAAAAAMSRNPALEPSVFRFIVAVVLTRSDVSERHEYPPVDASDAAERARFTERLQQFTGSVFARGVEDTAFYRYQPLLALNEVGGNPGNPGRTPAEFHAANAWRRRHEPRGLLTTSTHDTKLGEDARARISVLSERPDEWAQMFVRWRRAARPSSARHRASRAVDPNDAYRFYQAVVGTFPFDPDGARALDDYTARLVDYMRKSIREAKTHTSWLNPNDAYEAAVSTFVTDSVARLVGGSPQDTGVAFLRRVARVGAINGLAQLVLKLGAPGVVDIYQGAELWDLNLVDPDNRRPVDFERRRRMLDELEPLISSAASGNPDAAAGVRRLLADWPSGAIKMFVTAAGLRLRVAHSAALTAARYETVGVSGLLSDHVVAYLRRDGDFQFLVVAPRLVAGMMNEESWPLGSGAWGSAALVLPHELERCAFLNVLTGERLRPRSLDAAIILPVAEIFQFCPVALLKSAVQG